MTNEEKALIALLVAAFLLSRSDIKSMAALILTARIASMKAAYSQASSTVGISDEDWEPPDDLCRMAKDVSEQDAESIANTYKDDLEGVATAFVVAWMTDHESLDGAESSARVALAEWAIARAEWKSKQIADYTTGSGANDGTDMWIGDFLDGDLDLPDGISEDDVEVEIQPEDAVCKECKEIAGERFSLDEADDIELPAHPACPHHKTIVLKDS